MIATITTLSSPFNPFHSHSLCFASTPKPSSIDFVQPVESLHQQLMASTAEAKLSEWEWNGLNGDDNVVMVVIITDLDYELKNGLSMIMIVYIR